MAKILVVGDSKFSRNRAIEALPRAGHEMFEASDWEVGLEVVATHAPDCVLLEMLMPVLDGSGFPSSLRAGGFDLPVVVVTADFQASTRELCENLGVSGLLQKPARGDDICRTVQDALIGPVPGKVSPSAIWPASRGLFQKAHGIRPVTAFPSSYSTGLFTRS